VSTERFLKQRAVKIAVEGHYVLPKWYDPRGKLQTFPCRTSRVSPYRMLVDVPVTGKVGDHLTSYFRDFGKLDGHISDTGPGSFLLELDVNYPTRERLANKLAWLEGKLRDPQTLDQREHPRVIPAQPRSSLTLADGTILECDIIDMSLGGAAVSAELQPEVGTALAVGACVGRVVRVFPNGFAVQFIEKQKEQDLARLISRPMTSYYATRKVASELEQVDFENADVDVDA
jgi:hypothetical protein